MIKTTQDLIKILPFDEEFKKDVLRSYDEIDAGKKFNIQRMLWDTYDALFELKMQQNISVALGEAKQNREKLDSNFYKRVRDLAESEMVQLTAEDMKAMDLGITRDRLQDIISDTKQ